VHTEHRVDSRSRLCWRENRCNIILGWQSLSRWSLAAKFRACRARQGRLREPEFLQCRDAPTPLRRSLSANQMPPSTSSALLLKHTRAPARFSFHRRAFRLVHSHTLGPVTGFVFRASGEHHYPIVHSAPVSSYEKHKMRPMNATRSPVA
jgi:hypothetical protein